MDSLLLSPAEAAYDTLAPAYDILTADYCHDLWLRRIESLAITCGLTGRDVLDIACGTGKSFLPLLDRGYVVEACDLSAVMVELAQRKAGDAARVSRADMRDLPRFGAFDLVLCLDDAVNYLLDETELVDTFRGVAANLSGSGLFIFDVNALETYRTAFATDWVHESDAHVIAWRGRGDPDAAPGAQSSACVEVFTRTDADGLWQRRTSIHHQRHWQVADITRALTTAGLHLVTCKGQRRGAELHDDPDAIDNHKLLFVAGRRPAHTFTSSAVREAP
ncbi:MAG: Methyltransferase type 11 [Solirubrobacterales bacterium]|nr:Methyltransferase type 11 [Solirubrobacterales bacterium]